MSFNKKPNIKEIRKKGERPNKKHVNPDDNIKSKHSNNKQSKHAISFPNGYNLHEGDKILSVVSEITDECTCDVNTVNTVRGIKVGDVLYGVVSSMEDYGYIVNVANSVDVFVNSKNSVLSDESDESSKMEEDSQEESNESSNSSKEMEESSEESSSNEEMSESKEDESEEDDDNNNNEEEESSEEMSGSESSEEPTTLKTVKKIKVGAFVQIQITEEIGGKYKGIEASTSTIVEQSTNVRIGCHVHITDEEFTQNGYIVKFCGLRGYCHDFHHSTQNNEAVIVYYDSQTHKYHLSMLPHVICEDFELQSPLPIYSLTDFTVKQIDRHVGIIGSVSDSNVFLPVKQINDEIVKFVPELYTKNSTHKARVMFYSAFDGLCGITTRASILDSNFQTIYDIKPAMHVTGTIKEITKDGVIVKFGEKVFGFCDRKHSADIPIDDLSAVFKENQNKNSYYLTHKRTLMNPNTTVISSVVDTPLNTIAHGVVVSVDTKRGVIVKFFNEVTGFIPTIELFNQSIENITVGQIIKTRVISFDKKSLLLSLNLYPEEGAVERFANLSNHFVVGQIYSGIVVAKRSKSLLVRLRHNEFQYISVLPNYLVLDNDSGEDIPKIIQCLLLTNSLGKLIITTKKSLINLSGKIPNVTERESIDSGKHIGYVSRITPRYAFITFYNNVSMRYSNLPISDILSVGQTVCGYVNKKKQIILKQSSVGSISDEHLLLDVTTSTTPEIGSVVKFAINDIKSFGIVGKIKALDMTAFMPVAGVSGHLKDYNNANTTTAVIVAVDEEKGVVDCISEKLVKAKKLVTGSVHTSKVVLNREHYCIALVDGCIVYVNKKRMNGGHYQVEDTVDIIVCEQIEKLNNVYRGTVRYIPTSFNVTNNHIVIGSTVTGVVSFSTETSKWKITYR
ncbi:Programmed cell death protein [Entamoeba marina]